MYELCRLALHNWYVFEAHESDVIGAIAVVGPTGSGKSALLDGIQVVVTGGNQNFIDLNSSAGEKQDRTIRSYCLGQITDVNNNEPARDRCESILTLSYRDRETGDVISVGILLQADAHERIDDVRARFVVRGYEFSFSDFVERDADGDKYVVANDEVIDRLKRKFGKNVSFHPTAKAFVAEYLTAMRPRATPDPMLFLRSFNNAILAREIKNPTDFVRRFVLEPDPIDVDRIRSSIETWRAMEKRALELETELREIRVIRGRFSTWGRQTVEAQTAEFMVLEMRRMALQIEIEELNERRNKAAEERARMQRLMTNHAAAIRDNTDEVLRKRTMLAESDESAKLKVIEVEENATNRNAAIAQGRLEKIVRDLAQIAQFRAFQQMIPLSRHAAIDAAADLGKIPKEGLAVDANALADKAQRALSILGARDSLVQQRDHRIERIGAIKRERTDLAQSLQGASAGGASLLSPHVRQFIEELKGRGIRCSALPDAVDVTDETWATALEMLLGPNREALIIHGDGDHLERAFEQLWMNRSRWHGVRIVNTRKTRLRTRTLPPNSIAGVLRTDNIDARAFVDAQVGRFVRAETERELHDHEHAVMRNGKTTSSLSMRVYQDLRPILGKTAQAAAVAAGHVKLTDLTQEGTRIETERTLLDAGIAKMASLAEEGDIVADIRDACDEIRRAELRLAALDRERSTVETAENKRIREEIAAIERQTKAYQDEFDELQRGERDELLKEDSAKRQAEEKQAEGQRVACSANAIEVAQGQERSAALVAFAEAVDLTIGKAKAKLSAALLHERGREGRYLIQESERAKQSAEALRRNAAENERRGVRVLSDYVNKWLLSGNPLPEDADTIDQCLWCASRERRIEEHELRPHRDKVAEARREMESALKEDLLAKMSDRFQKAKTQVDVINRRLEGHRFVGQRYSFSRWVAADFKPVYDLVQRVISQDGSFADVAGGGDRDEEIKQAMTQIEGIVSREEDAKRLEDYRNYFEFELHIENEAGQKQAFSKNVGSLSGGQRQAPYYVAIAASMGSVYHPKGPGDPGMKGMSLVVFDEAFNKLDIGNTQRLLKLYRDLGLQLLVAAPEWARPMFLESVDCIISAARRPNTSDVVVDVEHIGPRARSEMAEANPDNRGIEWFRGQVEQRKAAE